MKPALPIIAISFFIIGWFSQMEYHRYCDWNKYWDDQRKFINMVAHELVVMEVEEQQKKVATENLEKSYNKSVMLLVKKIKRKESSDGMAGHAVTCKQQGKSNPYGYGLPRCFMTEEEATQTVYAWIDRHIKNGLTIQELLCKYNTGKVTSDCSYARSIMNMKI